MLTNFWETKVPKGHKHFIETMGADKVNRLKTRVKKHFFQKLDWSNIERAIDWGCGGGLHTNTIKLFCKVLPMDISAESLEQCRKFSNVSGGKLIPDNLTNLDLTVKEFQNIDLIFCADVIHHFPSLDYFENVCGLWNQISPKYICAQFKLSKDNIDNPNYFKSQNYLHRLFLSEKYVKSMFDNYECVSFETEKSSSGKITHGFMVLKKKSLKQSK